MARIRTVKPEHWSDKSLAAISTSAHLLWIGTWNFSDDEGIFENDPLLLKSQVFPRKTEVTPKLITKWLMELENEGFIIAFEHGGTQYYKSRTFTAHQKIDRPTPSKIPDDVIFKISQNTRRTLDESSTPIRVEESRVEESRVVGAAPVRFLKPTTDQLTDYFMEIGLDDFSAMAQAKLFFDWYEGNGWKVGKAKNAMKDWKATVRTWKGRMNDFKNTPNATTQSGIKTNSKNAGAYALLSKAKSDFQVITGRAESA
jgi:hypothetical protein